MLNPSRECAGDVDLNTLKASYSPEEVVKRAGGRGHLISDKIYPPLPIVALVLTVGFLKEYSAAESANTLRARDASVTGHRTTFAFVPRKLTVSRTIAHSAVKAVDLAELVRGAGPITQNVGAIVLGVKLPTPRIVQRVPSLYSTAMTPSRPLTDWRAVIFSMQRRLE